ncbi:MAG: beta-lactamase family protein [Acidovorax sp.]|jgi:CubicO group peptidase (beta-lactamase class C family)|uniref:serine hydrolase domain-containing protein n=1 Tax=Acidovorax sp. TaxID=1872122 RepID=UPI0025C47647|nr:serine hydrolase domain-containing protein [Acidovorax sp.]MBL7088364.1 beta-lactamase family protein [Acidovorax sp.]MCO4093451.1 beta-lactamase family protein [Acidovorax sp.]
MIHPQSTRRGFLALGSSLVATSAGLVAGCGSAEAAASSWNTALPLKQVSLSNGALVSGYVSDRFMPVFDEFVRNFEQRGEIGASLAMTHKGLPALEAWGGFADTLSAKPSRPWQRDQLSLVFSCTKAATALCAHILIAEGVLDLNRPIAHYWPEFAAQGKGAATVRMALHHSAGVPAIPFATPVPDQAWADVDYMTKAIAQMSPWWEPGTMQGYHALTFGWLIGELIRRVSGVSLGKFFHDRVANPLGMDFWIGLPSEHLERVAPMLGTNETLPGDPFMSRIGLDPTGLQAAVFFNAGGWFGTPPSTPPAYNSRLSLQSEIGAAGGVTNGRGLATMYAALVNAGGFNGVRLLPDDYAAQLGTIHAATAIDQTFRMSSRFGLGFHGAMDNRQHVANASIALGTTAYGHAGFGGSIGFGDPAEQMSFGYHMTRMAPGAALNERGQSLVDAAYAALGYRSKRNGFWV